MAPPHGAPSGPVRPGERGRPAHAPSRSPARPGRHARVPSAAGPAGPADRPAHRTASADRSADVPCQPVAPQRAGEPASATPAKLGGLPEGAEVEVRVLGPVEVRGAARPFQRAWTLELVVYLAMHPRGATTDGWATALWPDRLMADPTLHSTVSAARRALGRSSLGRDHLPHRRGALQLAPTVCTDWQRLGSLSATDDPDAWRAGLGLVRGRPFDGLRSPDWTVLEGVAAAVEDGVVQLAIRLAEHLLGKGDGLGAARAARRGLLASPYDERLYRLLLRAADRQGNPAGVEAAMGELLRLVAGEGGAPPPGGGWAAEAVAHVHPDTAALYRTLSRRRRAQQSGASEKAFARL